MAALTESRVPIERRLARLAAVSSESLAKPAAIQRRVSPPSPARAAATVPRPSTRSLIPIVRISSVSAAVGSWPASRMGARGAVTSATPTADLSHPIASQLVIGTDDSVLVAGAAPRCGWCQRSPAAHRGVDHLSPQLCFRPVAVLLGGRACG